MRSSGLIGTALRRLLRMTSSRQRPWQLSAAVAMGVACGLLPKSGLLFFVALGCCYLLPIHLVLAVVTCAAVSLLAPYVESSAGRLGLWSLTDPRLLNLWTRIEAYPLVPWLGLHNSVIHGSLLMAASQLLPTFVLTLPLARRLAPPKKTKTVLKADPDFELELRPAVSFAPNGPVKTSEHVEVQAAPLVDWSSQHTPEGMPRKVSVAETTPTVECNEQTFETDNADIDAERPEFNRENELIENATTAKLKDLLATCRQVDDTEMDSIQIAARAAEMAEYVDKLLAACALEETQGYQASALPIVQHASAADENRTTIEILRRVDNVSANDESPVAVVPLDLPKLSPAKPTLESPPGTPRSPETTQAEVHPAFQGPASDDANHVSTSNTSFGAASNVKGNPLRNHAKQQDEQVQHYSLRREESLRHLLHHLRAINEKV